MRVKKTSYPPVNLGTSFLLVIFIILCMIIFAALSLSSALKDYEYSEKNAVRTKAYYEACNQAEEIRVQIEAAGFTEETIEYAVPIDEDEILHVILFYQPTEHTIYQIKSWTQESVSQWSGTETLPVLGSH